MLAVTIPAPGYFLNSSFQLSPAMDAVRVDEGGEGFPWLGVFPMADGDAVDIGDVFWMRDARRRLSGADEMTTCALQVSVD